MPLVVVMDRLLQAIYFLIAKILSTAAYGNKNTKAVRGITVATCAFCLLYNAAVFSLAGIASEAFTLVSVLTAIFRLDLLPWLKNRFSPKTN